ncbi:hypothetical protein EsH8_VII_000205 [Colletotrichum jinshuiense]
MCNAHHQVRWLMAAGMAAGDVEPTRRRRVPGRTILQRRGGINVLQATPGTPRGRPGCALSGAVSPTFPKPRQSGTSHWLMGAGEFFAGRRPPPQRFLLDLDADGKSPDADSTPSKNARPRAPDFPPCPARTINYYWAVGVSRWRQKEGLEKHQKVPLAEFRFPIF